MKGIHIQFEGIINFINATLNNRTTQTADCYLLNLEKITLETFTILHIALTNTHQIPLDVTETFQKTVSKFKEYFKNKPKFETEKEDNQNGEYDEVQHFLENRTEIKLTNDRERGELYKFLSENEEKDKNNQIMLDNIPKYAYDYASPKPFLEPLKEPIKPEKSCKERSQQTYPVDFIQKTELCFARAPFQTQEKAIQTNTTAQGIKQIVQQFLSDISGSTDSEETKKIMSELLANLQTCSSQVMKKLIENRFKEVEGEVSEAEKIVFLKEIMNNTEQKVDCKDLKLFLECQKVENEVKKKQKINKNNYKRASQMPRMVGKSELNINNEVLKRLDENKSTKTIGGVLEKCQVPSQKNKNTERTSISKFSFQSKQQKSKGGRGSQFLPGSEQKIAQTKINVKEGSQRCLDTNLEKLGALTFNNIQIVEQEEHLDGTKYSQQKCKDSIITDAIKEEKQDKIVIEGNPKGDTTSRFKKIKEMQDQKKIAEAKKKEAEDSAYVSKDQSQSTTKQQTPEQSCSNIEKEAQKQVNQVKESVPSEQVNQIKEKAPSEKCAQQLQLQEYKKAENQWNNTNRTIFKEESLTPVSNIQPQTQIKSKASELPIINKVPKWSSISQYNSKDWLENSSSLSFTKQLTQLQTVNSKIKANHLSHKSLHFTKGFNVTQNLFSPKRGKYVGPKPESTFNYSKFPDIKQDQISKPEIHESQDSIQQKQQKLARQNQRILNQIKQNVGTRKNKNVQWVKLLRNIKQYEILHAKSCGSNCVHLSKFYEFLKKHNLSIYTNRREYSLHKKNIEINTSFQ